MTHYDIWTCAQGHRVSTLRGYPQVCPECTGVKLYPAAPDPFEQRAEAGARLMLDAPPPKWDRATIEAELAERDRVFETAKAAIEALWNGDYECEPSNAIADTFRAFADLDEDDRLALLDWAVGRFGK